MKLGAKNATTGWKAISLAMICVLLLGPLTACDDDVNTALVTGMNEVAVGMATTLIDAAFLMITPDESTSNGTGTDTTDTTDVTQI